jgi:multidrug efflux pump subunit AcrA (membrane-fusion protein)
VEMIVWSVAVLIWRISAPETAIHHLAFIVMAASGLTILFNFNPLIRLDGYYLLSDYLDIPNLRQRAFAHIKGLFARRLLGLETEEKPLGLREKRIYISYGLIALAYTVGLLGFVLYRLSRYLVHTYGWWALALVITGALYAVRNQVKEAVRDASEKIEEHKEEVLLAVLFFVPWPLKVKGSFVLLPEGRATVRTEIEGTIAKVLCQEGDRVRAGDPIVELAGVEIESAAKQTDAEIDEAEARLELLKEGARPQEIQKARSEVKAAEVSLELEQSKFKRSKELLERQLISEDEYERAKSTVDLREQELEGARAELSLLLAGSRPEEIREAEATLERLRAARGLLDYQKGVAVIRSPIAGIVLTPFMDQLANVYVEPGDEVCQIADCSVMIAEIEVPEKEVGDVAIGKKVKVKAKGFPSRSFYGKVTSIAQKADPGENQNYVTVRSYIDNPDAVLRPGMTGKAKIYCRRSSPLRIVIRRIVRSIRTEFWW